MAFDGHTNVRLFETKNIWNVITYKKLVIKLCITEIYIESFDLKFMFKVIKVIQGQDRRQGESSVRNLYPYNATVD